MRVDIHQVGSSCGFSMPFFDFVGYRDTLNNFFEKRVEAEERGDRKDGIERYWAYKNAESMDGLPGMRRAVETGRKEGVVPIKKMVGPLALEKRGKGRKGLGLGLGSSSPVVVGVWGFVLGLLVAVLIMEYVRGDLQGDFVNYSEEIRALLSR